MEGRSDASAEETAQFIIANAEYALFHEVGYALIDLLALPVLGREEDTFDTLSAVITLDILEDPASVLSEAELWKIYDEVGSIAAAALARSGRRAGVSGLPSRTR